jgi:predicted anti-sigma-YlaC factor YlaD
MGTCGLGVVGMRDEPYLATFRGRPCESCQSRDSDTVVPAHLNLDASGKHDGAVAALCYQCHAVADGRTDAPLDERRKIWMRVARNLMIARWERWNAESVDE